jgi:predicted site-specific integrase-resolvase
MSPPATSPLKVGDPIEPLLKATEAGEILRQRPSTIYSWAESGRLPCIRIPSGKRKFLVRFERSALIDFLKRHRVGGNGK